MTEANENKLSIEECKALYFDKLSILESPRTVYRLNGHIGGRFYYTLDKGNEPSFYISVTNKLDKVMPTSPHLIKWIADMGHKQSKEHAKMRADYGTLMHILFTRLLIQREVDISNEFENEVSGYLQENRQPTSLVNEWCRELRKDVIAFAQFVYDHNVQPVMIEVVLASDINGDAGALDLVCTMDIEVVGLDHENPYKSGVRKGEPREVKVKENIYAIVDYKSGKNGFYESHELQLADYKELLYENFPSFKEHEIRLFNFAPNDWRSKPSYKLKDQTDSKNIGKLPFLHEIGKIELSKVNNTALVIDGVVSLNNGVKSLENNYQYVSLQQLIAEDGREN